MGRVKQKRNGTKKKTRKQNMQTEDEKKTNVGNKTCIYGLVFSQNYHFLYLYRQFELEICLSVDG